MNVPCSTEQEARRDAAAPGPGGSTYTRSKVMLTRACWSAHVEAGAFDARIPDWPAGYEPSTRAAAAGMLRRAFDAGRERAGSTR